MFVSLIVVLKTTKSTVLNLIFLVFVVSQAIYVCSLPFFVFNKKMKLIHDWFCITFSCSEIQWREKSPDVSWSIGIERGVITKSIVSGISVVVTKGRKKERKKQHTREDSSITWKSSVRQWSIVTRVCIANVMAIREGLELSQLLLYRRKKNYRKNSTRWGSPTRSDYVTLQ